MLKTEILHSLPIGQFLKFRYSLHTVKYIILVCDSMSFGEHVHSGKHAYM